MKRRDRIKRDARIRKLYGEGLSVRAIAEKLGIGKSTVHDAFDKVGVVGRPRVPPSRLLEPPLSLRLERLAQQGHHLREIARILGFYPNTISRRARELGITIRRVVRVSSPETLKRAERIRAIYATGLNMVEVAAHLDCTVDAVAYALGLLNVTIHKRAYYETHPRESAKVVDLYARGVSGPRIAEQFGWNFYRVYDILKAAGVARRGSGARA